MTHGERARPANTIKGRVNVYGGIEVNLKLTLKDRVIESKQGMFVMDTLFDTILLGLPFIEEHIDEISFRDCIDTEIQLDEEKEIETHLITFEERTIRREIKSGDYYLCFVQTTERRKEETAPVIDIAANSEQACNYRQKILDEFSDVVTEEQPNRLPPTGRYEHKILLLEPTKQVNRRQYPLSFKEKQELTKQVKDLLDKGFIRKSSSPYNSPILFVRKKDKTMRMCVDFRLLNNETIKDRFPLPKIDELISKIGKAQIYSKLDLMSGYHQVRIAKDDMHKTAFSTDKGHYEWVVMPFGLTNAPATFQRMMNEVLEDYIDDYVQVYLDDIFIYSESLETHYQHIRNVLQRLRTNELIAKKSKCAFYYEELRFLGYVIASDGVKTDPNQVLRVKEWPTPVTIKEAQMFLGLTSYYRRFVKDHSKIAHPIQQYITKRSDWGKAQDESFKQLKNALINAPVLVHPSWKDENMFKVSTDACGNALGYVLEELDKNGKSRGVIAYGSKKLIGAQVNYSIYDRDRKSVV